MAKVNFNYKFLNIITFNNSELEKEANQIRSDSMYQWFLKKAERVEEEITTDEEITISVEGEIVCENGVVKLENKNIVIIASDETKKLISDIFNQNQI